MGKLIDLTGQRFGSLVVLERDLSNKKNAKWLCQCDCGQIVSKYGYGLIKGETTCCNRNTCPNKKERFENLREKVFGRLTAIEPTNKRINNSVVWKCICDCGNETEVSAASLKTGRTKSCGCLKQEKDKQPKGNVIDLVGQEFNKLTVLERNGSDNRGEACWLCKCECGNIISVLSSNLRSGHTTSCGCERRSRGELAIAKLLTENNISFEQEVSMFKFANGTNARFDFYVDNKYLIEYDGETHYQYNLHGWHTLEQLQAQQERDVIKNQWCIDNNIPLIRIPYTNLNELSIDDLKLETSKFLI